MADDHRVGRVTKKTLPGNTAETGKREKMEGNYLIVHKSILPECYLRVIKARRLLETGKASDISSAVKAVGISRSTYYKYKDYVFEPSEKASERKAVLSMMLYHSPGVLNAVLSCISELGGSILAMTQSLPINDWASVTISLDVSGLSSGINELCGLIGSKEGVEQVKLLALE